MVSIVIDRETEGKNNWAYDVRVVENNQRFNYCVTLNWMDYDLWCRGRVAPERVVRAIFEYLLAREPAEAILTKFDCSLVRRYFPQIDAELPKKI